MTMQQLPSDSQSRMAAIGTFDGVHRGHQALISGLRDRSAALGYKPLVVTFDRHPLQLIAPDNAPALLMTPDDRFAALRRLNPEVAVVTFTDAVRRLTAREFMAMLRDRHNVAAIYMGYNHHFGSDRLQNIEQYRAVADELGMKIYNDVEAFADGHQVSSTIVRRQLEEGDVAAAVLSLGRPYSLTGIVGPGRQLGRQLGFPTANLTLLCPQQLIPAPGVYACTATLPDGRTFKAMVNIGTRPSVTPQGPATIEAHLLDFTGDLYNRPLTLNFISRLRPEQRFPSLEALTAQLRRDALATRSIQSPINPT